MDSAYGLKKGCKRKHKLSLVLKYKGGSYLSIPDNYHITVSLLGNEDASCEVVKKIQ